LQTDYAGVLLGLGRNNEAETRLREAIRLDPQLWMAHDSLALVLFRQGKSGDAETEYRESVRLGPLEHKTHLNLSTFLLRQNRLDEAQKEIQEALRLEPNSSDALQNLGEVHWRQGKLAEAEQLYRKGYESAKGYAKAARQLARFLAMGKGQKEYDEGKLSECEESNREATRLWPAFATAYNNLGCVLIANSNRWAEAEALIKKSLDLSSDGEKPGFLDSLGELLSKQPKRKSEAVAAYQEALAGYSKAGNSNQVSQLSKILQDLSAPNAD